MNFFVFNLRILAIEITKLNFGAKNRKDFFVLCNIFILSGKHKIIKCQTR